MKDTISKWSDNKRKMNRYHENKMFVCLSLSAMLLLPGNATTKTSFGHDYAAWGDLLGKFTQNGFMDYEGLKKAPQDLDAVLKSYQAATQDEYEKWTRDQKISFWLNVYNYSAINLVVEHYPIQKKLGWKALAYPDNSIQQIPDVWDRKAIRVLGKERSLNEIEHEILRKELKEPRIHFALVCASLGCPVIRKEPYQGEKLNAQLDEQARTFLLDPRKARYEDATDTLHISPIFKWFQKDFEKTGGILAFVNNYLTQEAAYKISVETKIKWLDYSWSLNERKGGS